MIGTKKDIAERIAEKVGVTGVQAREIMQATLDNMVETLVMSGRIELRNFGVFTVKSCSARKARNPRTGEEVMVPAKNVVKFKPGKVMTERVAEMGCFS